MFGKFYWTLFHIPSSWPISINVSGISTAYNLSNTFNVWKIAGNSAGCIYAVLLYGRSCKELKNLCNLPKYGFALNYVIAAYVFCDIGWTRHVVLYWIPLKFLPCSYYQESPSMYIYIYTLNISFYIKATNKFNLSANECTYSSNTP